MTIVSALCLHANNVAVWFPAKRSLHGTFDLRKGDELVCTLLELCFNNEITNRSQTFSSFITVTMLLYPALPVVQPNLLS